MLCHQRRLPFFGPVLDQFRLRCLYHRFTFDRFAPAAVEASLVS